jgi:hypothetical protein
MVPPGGVLNRSRFGEIRRNVIAVTRPQAHDPRGRGRRNGGETQGVIAGLVPAISMRMA